MQILNFFKNVSRPTKGASYLIEFRFQGYAKKYLKSHIWAVSKKFKVAGITHKRVVPHISFVGPFKTKNEKRVVSRFLAVCKKYEWVNFYLKGFDHFENRVIYVDVHPSSKMEEFRTDLFHSLESDIYTVDTDFVKPFAFHSTIAFKDIQNKFEKIWGYINSTGQPKKINQVLLRVTILKNGKILYEYDFLQKRLLNRNQARNKEIFKKTLQLLKNH